MWASTSNNPEVTKAEEKAAFVYGHQTLLQPSQSDSLELFKELQGFSIALKPYHWFGGSQHQNEELGAVLCSLKMAIVVLSSL